MQKQSFADVLQNRCSQKFRKFHRKAIVLESFLIKLRAFRPATLLKRDSNTGVFCETCKIFKNTFFYKISPLSASNSRQLILKVLMRYIKKDFRRERHRTRLET